jgi:hypothetical protein
MFSRLQWLALILFASLTGTVRAELTAEGYRQRDAIDAMFPGKNFGIWESALGDLNGDGIADAAHIIMDTNSHEDRLVVLAGQADGTLKPLSVSGLYCEIAKFGKFYNLDIRGNSLFTQAYYYVDSARASSITFQFRFNPKLNDFELIGREELDEEYNRVNSYRVSYNYLSKNAVLTRKLGKKTKTIKIRLKNPVLLRLQGFACGAESSDPLNAYIDDDFKVKK